MPIDKAHSTPTQLHVADANTASSAQDVADTPNESGWLCTPQPKLGTKGMVLMLSAVNIICPLSLDMFTPAVPSLPGYFSTTAEMVNFTIFGFYLLFAVGMLLFGPVCDRHGRKPVLVGSLAAFTLGSILCATAWSIETLIVFRLIQATGAGAACAVSTAIVKDCFKPEKRTQLLTILQVLMVVGPVIAPLLGGVILMFFSWHATFVVLSFVGAICVPMTMLFRESLPENERVDGGVRVSLMHMAGVAKNTRFMVFLLFASLFSAPFMAYVQVASYIYIDYFGTTQQVYSYFFAATAALSLLGPLLFLKLSQSVSIRAFTYGVLFLSAAAGIVLLAVGHTSMFLFFACLALFVTAEATIRPYCTDILLTLQDKDTGSASALMNFTINFVGALGMVVVTLFAADYIIGLGTILMGSMLLAVILWLTLLFKKSLSIAQLQKNAKPQEAAKTPGATD